LLKDAIRLGRQVFVLSIPDWGLSPFAHGHLPDAKGRTIDDVAAAIDAFNATAAGITRRYDVMFIDITTHGRAAGSDPELFTADGLHPAAGTYRFWA
jgi:lysophospholipase L1-like esterase